MSIGMGNDLADLIINGNIFSGDPFLSINDSIILRSVGDNDVQTGNFAANDALSGKAGVLAKIKAKMSNYWKSDPTQLAFFMSPNNEEIYRNEVGEKYVALSGTVTENKRIPYQGSNVIPVGPMGDDVIIFTNPKNIKLGINKRYMRLGRFLNERKRCVELTLTSKADWNYAVGTAMVIYTLA